jgi:hypothetical protein
MLEVLGKEGKEIGFTIERMYINNPADGDHYRKKHERYLQRRAHNNAHGEIQLYREDLYCGRGYS